jgi:hypothetical protein
MLEPQKRLTKATRAWLYALGLGAVFASAALYLAHPAWALEGLSCKDRIVNIGDGQYRVRSLCGPPDDIQQHIEQRPVRRPIRIPCGARWCTTYIEDIADVPVEEWTYDFGPQRFLQYLTFETGRLVRVRAGEYGHKTWTDEDPGAGQPAPGPGPDRPPPE